MSFLHWNTRIQEVLSTESYRGLQYNLSTGLAVTGSLWIGQKQRQVKKWVLKITLKVPYDNEILHSDLVLLRTQIQWSSVHKGQIAEGKTISNAIETLQHQICLIIKLENYFLLSKHIPNSRDGASQNMLYG